MKIQEDALSPLLSAIAMMPRKYIIWNYNGAYKFTKSQENIQYMDDIKQFAKTEKELEAIIQTLRI